MSKIGKLPIDLPEGVKVEIKGKEVSVSGVKGTLSHRLPEVIDAKLEGNKLILDRRAEDDRALSLHGTSRAILANMVKGVVDGWSKTLELVGTGYRAEVNAEGNLVLMVGFSHPVVVNAPEGITFKVEKSDITVSGIDRELVGLVAARVRAVRPPEPYKGKGIRYKGEVVRRKAGKAVKAAA
jgi:large subunit ribosomal protein L6